MKYTFKIMVCSASVLLLLFAACGKPPREKDLAASESGKDQVRENSVTENPGGDIGGKAFLPADHLQDRGGAERTGRIEGPVPVFPLRIGMEWKGNAAFRASVTVTADSIFFAGTDGRTICLRRGGWELLWSFQAQSPVFAAGAYEDGLYFIADSNGMVYALDALTGIPHWTAETGSGILAAPLLCGGMIIVGNEKGVLVALDQKSGNPVWTQNFPHSIYGAPSFAEGSVYLATEGGSAAAVSAEDGSVLWLRDVSGPVYGSLVFHRETLFGVTLSGGYFVLDGKTGKSIWEQKTESVFFASPAVKDDFAVFGDLGGNLFSVDTRTGLLRWRITLSGPLAFSPLLIDGRVLAATEDSFLYLVDETSGAEEGRAGVPGRTASGPVVLDGVLFIGTSEGRLYVMEGAAPPAGAVQRTAKPVFNPHYTLSPDGKKTEILLSSKGQNLHFIPSPGGVYSIEMADEPLRPVTIKLLDQDGGVLESNFEYSAMSLGFSYKFDGQKKYVLLLEPLLPEEGLFPVRILARFIGAKF